MVQYKLYYFNVRGYGESIRLALTYGGLEFEDVRIEKDKWPELKSKMPFGQMPVLEVDGLQIPQTLAILRYVSRKVGLVGSTPEEEAQVDALADLFKDMYAEIREYFYRKIGAIEHTPEELEKHEKETLLPARDKFLTFFTNYIKKSGSGYLVGKNLTFADLLLADHIFTFSGIVPGYTDKFPEIATHQKKVYADPKLAKWIESRPDTQV